MLDLDDLSSLVAEFLGATLRNSHDRPLELPLLCMRIKICRVLEEREKAAITPPKWSQVYSRRRMQMSKADCCAHVVA